MSELATMNDDWDETLRYYLQKLLPLVSSIVLVLFSYMPFKFLVPENIRPEISLICVYYWLLHRSDVFNLFSVFLVGFVDDVVTAAPWGSNIFQLLVLYVLVNNLLKFFNGKSFEVMWAGFVPAALISMLVRWLVVSIYYGQFLPLSLVMFSFLVTVALYPLITLINVFVQNKLMTDEV